MDIVLCILLLIAVVFIYEIIFLRVFIKVFEIPEEDYKHISTYRKYYNNDEYDYGHNITHNTENYD